MGDFMIVKFFRLIKKIILATFFIYSFDVFCGDLKLCIPINFFTVFLVSFFDIPALICLLLFSVTF